jgi:Protein of unknown function (DUF3263)
MTQVIIRPVTGVIGFEHDTQRGTLGVYQDGRRLGVIIDTGGAWINALSPVNVSYRVHDAGLGVPIPGGSYRSPAEAAAAILEARTEYRSWVTPGVDGLTDFERRALDFETTPVALATDGRRERAIRDQFRTTPTRYAAAVVALVTNRRETAYKANPHAVEAIENRLGRRRRSRTAA